MEFLLLIVAWCLKAVLSPILFAYGIVRSILRWELRQYFKEIAIALDVFGNVIGQYMFNDLLQKHGYPFGSRKDTISYALGKNEQYVRLTWLGKLIGKILDSFDKDHLKKAIK